MLKVINCENMSNLCDFCSFFYIEYKLNFALEN